MRGEEAIVLDSSDVRKNPRAALESLCDALGLGFTEKMLSWPSGGHPAAGVWAKHWYGAVWASTGVAEPEGPLPDVPDVLSEVLKNAMPYYERMRENSLYIG